MPLSCSGPSYALSYRDCSSLPNSSEAYGATYDTGAHELDDMLQQLGEGGLLTDNYLDALDSVSSARALVVIKGYMYFIVVES